jgi:hypothetical protein
MVRAIRYGGMWDRLDSRDRFLYWSMTTSNYKIHFTGLAEKVRPFIAICIFLVEERS